MTMPSGKKEGTLYDEEETEKKTKQNKKTATFKQLYLLCI